MGTLNPGHLIAENLRDQAVDLEKRSTSIEDPTIARFLTEKAHQIRAWADIVQKEYRLHEKKIQDLHTRLDKLSKQRSWNF